MKYEDRKNWLLGEASKEPFIDVLNRYFVDDYISATGATADPMPFGADRCRQLGRDLSRMYRSGLLTREVCGLRGMEWGFPKWVYVYRLTEYGRNQVELLPLLARQGQGVRG